jgi:hypothetical protein
MWIVRVEKENSNARHLLYKTEHGARKAVQRLKKDPDVKCRLFEERATGFKQEKLELYPY